LVCAPAGRRDARPPKAACDASSLFASVPLFLL
jgi:hypothetical protein